LNAGNKKQMNTETSNKHSADVSKEVEIEAGGEVKKSESKASEVTDGARMCAEGPNAVKSEFKTESSGSVNTKAKSVSEGEKYITKTPEGVMIVSMDELMKYNDDKYSDKGKKMIFGMWLNAEFKNELQKNKNNVRIFKVLSAVSAAAAVGILVYVSIETIKSF